MELSVEVSREGIALVACDDHEEFVVSLLHFDVLRQDGVLGTVLSFGHEVAEPCEVLTCGQFIVTIGIGLHVVHVVSVAVVTETTVEHMLGTGYVHLGVRIGRVAQRHTVAAEAAGGLCIHLSVAGERVGILVRTDSLRPLDVCLVAVQVVGQFTRLEQGSIDLGKTAGDGTEGLYIIDILGAETGRVTSYDIVVAVGNADRTGLHTVGCMARAAAPSDETAAVRRGLAGDATYEDTVGHVELGIRYTHDTAVRTVAHHVGGDVHVAQHVGDGRLTVRVARVAGHRTGILLAAASDGAHDGYIIYITREVGNDGRGVASAQGNLQRVVLAVEVAAEPVVDVQPFAALCIVDVVHQLQAVILVTECMQLGEPPHVIGRLHQEPSVLVALHIGGVEPALGQGAVHAAADSSHTGRTATAVQRVGCGLAAKVGVAVSGTLHVGRAVALRVGRAVHLLLRLEGHGVVVLTDGLCPLDVALVMVQQEAYLTALEVFLAYERAACSITVGLRVEVVVGLLDVAYITCDGGTSVRRAQRDVVDDETALHGRVCIRPSHDTAAVGGTLAVELGFGQTVGNHGAAIGDGSHAGMRAVTGDAADNLYIDPAVRNRTCVLACDTSSILVLRGNLSLDLEVLHAAVDTDVAEQGLIVGRTEHVNLDGVALTVQAALEVVVFAANHGALRAVVDVGREFSCREVGAVHTTVHQFGKGFQFLGRTNLDDVAGIADSHRSTAHQQHRCQETCVQ